MAIGPILPSVEQVLEIAEDFGLELSAGEANTCCRLLEGFIPDIDATVVTRLLDAGATVLGETNAEDCSLEEILLLVWPEPLITRPLFHRKQPLSAPLAGLSG